MERVREPVLLLAALALVIVLAGYGWLVYSQQRTAGSVACQYRFTQKLSGVLAERATIGDDSVAATATLNAVLARSAAGSPAANAAYDVYRGREASIAAERKASPIPSPPRC